MAPAQSLTEALQDRYRIERELGRGGQLIRVSTGEILLDDSTELKGEPDGMVRVGTRIFAERVARTVRRGGVTINFPSAE